MTRFQTMGALATFLAPLACGELPGLPETEVEALPQQACRTNPETFKIGVLVDDNSPARTNFSGAALLAEGQLNEALDRAGIPHRFDVVVAGYAGDATVAQNVALDLVNNQGVLALVSDISGNTAAVNRLNYEPTPRLVRKVPVTCYQCSSASFNDPAATDPGQADPDNWLHRTFFNASFESAVQVRTVLNRPAGGEITNDGHLKIVVLYDSFHLSAATTMAPLLDSLHTGPHSVELVLKSAALGMPPTQAEMDEIFDGDAGGGGGPSALPDAVYLALLPQNAPSALSAYTAYQTASKPPATANNGVRRNFLLPSLLASGGEGLQGSSVLAVNTSRSGELFADAFESATGQQPELTTSFLYDAVVAQAIAIGVARSNGSTSPEQIQASFPAINEGGPTIRPSEQSFANGARRIQAGRPIDYDGASSPLELTDLGEMYPDLVHWKIENGQFVELERYRCDPQATTCAAR